MQKVFPSPRRAVGVIRTKVKDYNQKKSNYQSTTESSQLAQNNSDEKMNEPNLHWSNDDKSSSNHAQIALPTRL